MNPDTLVRQQVVREISRGLIALAICLGLLVLSGALYAQADRSVDENELIDDSSIEDEGIKGVIVDNTVTIIGRRFYDAFSMIWLDYQVGGDENFSIHELPTATSGSKIWVEYNREKLYEVFLSPVMSNIKRSARAAAKAVADRYETRMVEKALFVNPDLAPDEF